ncbi:MAG: hypothetical protein U9P81_10795 [Euryarchaeota archaeon]|nr:hypothetical protein [Euryarchaeota archaeon]
MSIEYDMKTNKRPNITKDMQLGDILHIGTEDEIVFSVVKVNKSEFLFKQTGIDASYIHSRGVMNQKIMDFDERNNAFYIVVEGDLDMDEKVK